MRTRWPAKQCTITVIIDTTPRSMTLQIEPAGDRLNDEGWSCPRVIEEVCIRKGALLMEPYRTRIMQIWFASIHPFSPLLRN